MWQQSLYFPWDNIWANGQNPPDTVNFPFNFQMRKIENWCAWVKKQALKIAPCYDLFSLTFLGERFYSFKFFMIKSNFTFSDIIYIRHALMIFQKWNGACNKRKVCQEAQASVVYLNKHSTLDFKSHLGQLYFLLKLFKPLNVNIVLKCQICVENEKPDWWSVLWVHFPVEGGNLLLIFLTSWCKSRFKI